jgi:hypothetical protein
MYVYMINLFIDAVLCREVLFSTRTCLLMVWQTTA